MKYVTNQFAMQVCAEICDGKIELLKSHTLAKHQEKGSQTEFIASPILKLVNKRLIKIYISESSIVDRFTQILSMLQEKPATEIGYTVDNILNLLAELNTDLRFRQIP